MGVTPNHSFLDRIFHSKQLLGYPHGLETSYMDPYGRFHVVVTGNREGDA